MHSSTSSSALLSEASGALRNARFGDIYFNPDHGAEESQHIFLAGNQLEQRWRARIKSNNNAPFVIGELGFGSGLNFLVTLQCWQNLHIARNATLYYYATEAHPLTRKALRKALAHCKPCPKLAAQLLEQYPDPVASSYTLRFTSGDTRAFLVLLFGDSVDALDQLEHYPSPRDAKPRGEQPGSTPAAPPMFDQKNTGQLVDAWYLDGFAPAKNPQMWQPALFAKLARHSHAGSSLASFSVARTVRDNLSACGFEVQRAPGFGRKREMLRGNFSGGVADSTASTRRRGSYPHQRAYYRQAQPLQCKAPQRALVIGAGIAGCCTASALAERGWRVKVIDRAPSAATTGASANDAAVLYARTAAGASPLSNWHEAAFHFASNFYRGLGCGQTLQGMLKLGEQLGEQWLQDHPECEGRRNVVASKASKIAAAEVSEQAIFYSQSGWIKPRDVCERLLEHDFITQHFGVAAKNLQRLQDCWLVEFDDSDCQRFDAVVIACAEASKKFAQSEWLPLKALRGQTSSIASCEHSATLRVPLCGKGYLVPAVDGHHECGASYSINEHDNNEQGTLALKLADHVGNLAKAKALLPNMTINETGDAQGRASLRCVTPDYLPLAGPLVDADEFRTAFAELARNARRVPAALAKPLPGLMVNCGYGSHGFTSAPLLAEILAAELCASPFPLADSLRRAVHPTRFLLREVVRGKISVDLDK
ncbi:MAG: FAD-dependent 5-carboxymethylaminomethyl-2-thiouridine(34) oxidoreductase MnmC [Gammaproteobacteria bacterium]|nr:FAD-dependent 5-carboxymethylaminomethyl-2-thiouridine(34) oxidoreductase MnmC [Gammaproteobacteria bacterium]MBT8150425.1 FAD-dependent 5-carboxymethylaminomethyl-2-thiouridine(34) oxidoreductase MnmC [Gammaproteobacteria bacterium]NND39438.1 FAD-dependent 5-carboxymethylaminomethyl-2-thiouridine(34) oxidoreductase MnmC [Pseudomonadales bacterium]NNM11773.1 FAD-dependent 5-carboxymethylaminomethyl-2-thiouridine(34) oxidoreductase MnmC [Pseudomonadales bacterium]RZV56336.1 MAG: FAD-dependent